jgi:hypothetical protein
MIHIPLILHALSSVLVLLVYSSALNLTIAARCHTNANITEELRFHVYVRVNAVGNAHD